MAHNQNIVNHSEPYSGWFVPPVDPRVDQSGSASAQQFFSLSFSGGQPNNITQANAHAGGGYINFLADSANGAGDGINATNISAETISDDPLFSGSVDVLRNTYQAGGTAYSFGNQTLFVNHPVSQKVYKRLRIRFSSNWQWGNDQLKFCKNKGPGDFETNCPKFDGAGRMYITKADPYGGYERYVYPTLTGTGNGPGDYYGEDDINNAFGVSDSDANWAPELDRWYWFEWEIDSGTPGQPDGGYKVWIDGVLYFQLDNVQVNQVGHQGFDYFELGHVWQTGAPTQDIFMDWHSLEIYDTRPDSLPGVF